VIAQCKAGVVRSFIEKVAANGGTILAA